MKMAEPGLRQIGRNLDLVEFSLWEGVAIWTELFGEGGRRFPKWEVLKRGAMWLGREKTGSSPGFQPGSE